MAAALVAFGSAATLQQATSSAPPRITADGKGVGPQIGERVPDFSLPDAHGGMHTLASVMGPNGATIVFFRSADWCAPCKAHLIEMQNHLEQLHRLGLNVIAISRDSQAILAEFVSRHGITYPLLSDATSSVIKEFGVLDVAVAPTRTEESGGPPYYGVPYRGTITVNHEGVVTSTFFQKTYQEHTTISSILLSLGKNVGVPARRISAPHVDVTSFTSDQAVAPGAHFLIVLDIRPASHVHVYAPGNPSYRPIALTIPAQPGIVTIGGADLPKPEDFFFKPLNEHVAVYQRPFRMTQNVMVDPSSQGQAALKDATKVVVNGTFDYQACDDKDCFNPQSLPLTWTVNLRPLDNTRIVVPKVAGNR